MGSQKLWESRRHSPFRVSGHTAEASFRRLRQALLPAVLSLAVLSGCGEKDSSRTLGIDGYVYVPQQVELSGMSLENFQIVDGYIYYRSGDYDSGTDLRRFPAEELLSQETPVLPSGESLFGADNPTEHIQDFTVSPDGCLYYLEYRSSPGETSALRLSEPDGAEVYGENAERGYVLAKQGTDGGEAFCVSLSGLAWAVFFYRMGGGAFGCRRQRGGSRGSMDWNHA